MMTLLSFYTQKLLTCYCCVTCIPNCPCFLQPHSFYPITLELKIDIMQHPQNLGIQGQEMVDKLCLTYLMLMVFYIRGKRRILYIHFIAIFLSLQNSIILLSLLANSWDNVFTVPKSLGTCVTYIPMSPSYLKVLCTLSCTIDLKG